jgi:hypothetical protein
MARSPRIITVEVSGDVHALVPRQREPEATFGLPDDVLAAIAAYADYVVGEAAPMGDETRAVVAALLRASAPSCTASAPCDARDEGSGERSEPAE